VLLISRRLSGYVAQIPIQVGVLEQLTNYLRSGSLSLAGNKYTPNKIVLIGHSVGTYIWRLIVFHSLGRFKSFFPFLCLHISLSLLGVLLYIPDTDSTIGSIISNALLATNPTIADGAVLTGWSPDSGLLAAIPCIFAGIQAKIANTVKPTRLGAYDNGWFTFVDIYAYIEL
jgi:hypothetical protein